jgi:uncharacterized protein YabE (DUF348 family)
MSGISGQEEVNCNGCEEEGEEVDQEVLEEEVVRSAAEAAARRDTTTRSAPFAIPPIRSRPERIGLFRPVFR